MALGDRVCRIETPYKLGTVFFGRRGSRADQFSRSRRGDSYAKSVRTGGLQFRLSPRERLRGKRVAKKPVKQKKKTPICRLASQWLVAKRPYSKTDIGEPGEAGVQELDYALLRLAKPIGKAPGMRAEERGWFSLAPERALLAVRDFRRRSATPGRRDTLGSMGNVLAFNSAATRVKYDAITDNGFSGSPCFTTDLDVFGLHHATDPAKRPTFNRAVPLDLIVDDLKAQKIAIH